MERIIGADEYPQLYSLSLVSFSENLLFTQITSKNQNGIRRISSTSFKNTELL